MLTVFFAAFLSYFLIGCLWIAGNTYESRYPVYLVPKTGIYNMRGGFEHAIFWNQDKLQANVLVPHGNVVVGWKLVHEGHHDDYEYVGDLPTTIKVTVGTGSYTIIRQNDDGFVIVTSNNLKKQLPYKNEDNDDDSFF